MKITLISATLCVGGAEHIIVNLANGLNRLGYEIDVVLVRRKGFYLDSLDKGVQVIDLSKRHSIFALFPLIRYLQKAKPSSVFAIQGHINALAVTARLLARLKFRLVICESTTVSVNNKYQGSIMQTILSIVYPSILKMADLVIALSKGTSDDLIANYKISPHHIRVIFNPLDITRLVSLASNPVSQPSISPQNGPIIMALGRLNQAKDLPTLIHAFAKVREYVPAHLLIVGEGEERESIENLVLSLNLSNHVTMPGFVENPFAYLKQSSVYVLSSRYEGLPTTLLEALTLGTPSVATDCPSGPREILEGGRWGRLVPVGDVNAMALAIIDGLEGRIAKPPFELMEANFGINVIIQKYLDVLLYNVKS